MRNLDEAASRIEAAERVIYQVLKSHDFVVRPGAEKWLLISTDLSLNDVERHAIGSRLRAANPPLVGVQAGWSMHDGSTEGLPAVKFLWSNGWTSR